MGEPPGLLNRILDRAMRFVLMPVVRLVFGLKSENAPNLQGPLVLVGNHTTLIDPLLVGAVVSRRITFMMTALFFRSPRMGWFFRWVHAIPVAVVGSNRDSMQAARAVLRRGGVLGVFPEGGISRDGLLQLGNPGAVWVVLRERVPVVPFAILGGQRAMPPGKLPRPARVRVRFGDPIPAAELMGPDGAGRKERLARATRRLMDEIAALGGQVSREAELERLRGKT